EMFERIQGEPPRPLSRIITLQIGRIAVADFVHDRGQNQNDNLKDKVYLHNIGLYCSMTKPTNNMKTCPILNKSSINAGGYSNRTRATQFNPTGTVRKYANFQKK